ncbi:MAG: hypothetical protein LBT14_10930 [Treponema sp.]|jgi:trk system potassium uptake protein TrkH|nr:hypothetical protein [Treponema sp.]
MNIFQKSDALYLLAFFLILIGIGTVLLMIPAAWHGMPPDASGVAGPAARLSIIDALFIATSAICVTGLSTLNIAAFSRFGHVIILGLIQIGGLGIISFTSILMTIPGHRFAISRRNTIQGFYLDGMEYNPRRIVRNIVVFTLIIEATGALLLCLVFLSAGIEDWLFMGIFHGVSAFCNAGFSPFAEGLSGFTTHTPLLLILMGLIIAGGLGFIVLHDMLRVFLKRKTRLSYHSRVVLSMTAGLILGGALLFFLIERNRLYSNMDTLSAITNAFFQSVTTRTAGFEIWPQTNLSQPSKLLTDLLMLIGGAPGSIAGGLKVTTIFVIVIVMMRKPDEYGDIKISHHRLNADTINKGVVYFLKAIALLLVCIAALSVTEWHSGVDFGAIIFENFSAFATVGLSLGLTPALSTPGKLVIILAMFAGRVGLIALAFPAMGHKNYDITYPEGSILLG